MLSAAGLAWIHATVGIILKPYETYRRIVDRGTAGEVFFIGVFLSLYFAFASLVKTSSLHPLLLTGKFVWLSMTAVAAYAVSVCSLWLLGRLVHGRGSFRGFAVAWAYTLIPTVVWFWATSLLYVFIPPPRTASTLGIAFSIIYLVFSTMLLLWKCTLAYLSLRFGLRLNFQKILVVVMLALPLAGLYGGIMYYLRVFRIPFL